MHSKVITALAAVLLSTCSLANVKSIQKASVKNNSTSTHTYFSPNEDETYFSIENGTVDSGDTVIANFNCCADLNSLSVLEKTEDLDITLTREDDNHFVSSLVTPRREGEYSATFYSEDLPLINGEPRQLAQLFVYSDGVHDSVSALSSTDARKQFFLEYVATEEERTLLGFGQNNIVEGGEEEIIDIGDLEIGLEDHPIHKPIGNIGPIVSIVQNSKRSAKQHFEQNVYGGTSDYQVDFEFVPKGTSVMNQNSSTGFYAQIQWCDDNGNLHPLKNTRVNLTSDVFRYYILTDDYAPTTDEEGCFYQSIPFNAAKSIGTKDIYLEILSETASTVIQPAYDPTYSIEIATSDYSNYTKLSDYRYISYDIVIYPGRSDRANAFEISQATELPRIFNETYTYIHTPQIVTYYPAYYTAFEFSAVPGSNSYLKIQEYDYNCWDVLTHEYSHFICSGMPYHANLFENTGSMEDFNFYGHHSSGEDLVEKFGVNKGLRVAYIEGLTTFFAIASQIQIAKYEGIPGVGDEVYSDPRKGVYEDYNEYGFGSPSNTGEGVSGSVASTLLKLFDNENRYDDNVSISARGFLNTLEVKKYDGGFWCFGDLMNTIMTRYPNLKNDIAKILEHEGFSSSLTEHPFYLSTNLSSYTWRFSWSNYSLGSLKPDTFDLIFVDDNGSTYSISNIHGNSITLSSEQALSVLNLSGFCISYYVVGYYSNIDNAGYYYSSLGMVHKPQVSTIATGINMYDSVTEFNTNWYVFTAPHNGTYTFETTGQSDTVGELFNEVIIDGQAEGRIDYDDNSGEGYNFKLSYQMTKGDVVYLRIRGLAYSAANYYLKVYGFWYQPYDEQYHIVHHEDGTITYGYHISDGSSFQNGDVTYTRCAHCGAAINMMTTPIPIYN